jgi:hypothetical protein
MSIINIQGGIPVASAVVDATTVAGSVSYDSNSGQFTDAGLSRVSQGIYRLTLGQENASTKMCVQVTVKAKNNTTKSNGAGNYIIVDTKTIEVITNDQGGYGTMDCDFSICVWQII